MQLPSTSWSVESRRAASWSIVIAALPMIAATLTYAMYVLGPAKTSGLLVAAVGGMVILWRPVYGVAAGLLVIPLESANIGLASFSPTELLMVVTALAAILRWLVDADRFALPPVHAVLFALVAVILVGAAFALDAGLALRVALMWGAFSVASLVVATSPTQVVKSVLFALVAAAGVVGIIAIVHGGNQELVQGGQNAVGRVGVVFNHPNYLAYFMILALPQAIVLVRVGAPVQRAIALAAIPLMILALMLTLSRTGIIGGLVALAVLLAWVDFRRVVGVLLVLLVLFGIANHGAIERSKQVTIVSQRLSTVHGRGTTIERDPRLVIWRTVPSMVADHPVFGIGARNFVPVSRKYGLFAPDGGTYDHAHDLLLTILVELGLAGLAVFLALLLAVGREAAVGWRRAGPHRPWVISLTASLVGLFVAGIGDYVAGNNAIWAATLVLVGALVAFGRAEAPEASPRGA